MQQLLAALASGGLLVYGLGGLFGDWNVEPWLSVPWIALALWMTLARALSAR